MLEMCVVLLRDGWQSRLIVMKIVWGDTEHASRLVAARQDTYMGQRIVKE